MPEHLAAWEGGRREPEDEDDEGGDESDSVHGKADQVLTLVEHYEVLWLLLLVVHFPSVCCKQSGRLEGFITSWALQYVQSFFILFWK